MRTAACACAARTGCRRPRRRRGRRRDVGVGARRASAATAAARATPRRGRAVRRVLPRQLVVPRRALSALRVARGGARRSALDCAGSGVSDGEYVSLGHFEQYDVQAVCEHLRAHRRAAASRSGGAAWARSRACSTRRNDPLLAAVVSTRPSPRCPSSRASSCQGGRHERGLGALRHGASHVSASCSTARAHARGHPRAPAACCAPAAAPRGRRLHRPRPRAVGPRAARRARLRVFDGGAHASRPPGCSRSRPSGCGATCTAPRPWRARHGGPETCATLGAARARPACLAAAGSRAGAGRAQGADEDLDVRRAAAASPRGADEPRAWARGTRALLQPARRDGRKAAAAVGPARRRRRLLRRGHVLF